jgi:hypothetical protein
VSKPSDIKSVSESRHARVCVFADPGVGKTRLVGSSRGKVLIIAPPTDHRDSMMPSDRKRVEEWIIRDWDDMFKCLDYLRHDGAEWDWVWVDSMSLLQDHLLDDLWETAIAEKPARKRYWVDKQEYGINMGRLGQWMRYVVGPDNFNFGFTAHTAQLLPSEDEDVSKKLMPWIQGKNMSPKFCGYMNVVAFMEVAKIGSEPNKRVLRLNATERYYAKDQFDLTDNGRIVLPKEGGFGKVEDLIEASRARAAGANKKRPGRTRRQTVKRRAA